MESQIYLHRMRLSVTAAGTSGTNWGTSWYTDTGNRYSSGGTLLTCNAVNPNITNASGALIHFGAVTATAANAQRQIHSEVGRTVIKVIGDTYTFLFGQTAPASIGMPTEGTLQLHRTFSVPALVIPPNCSVCFDEYAASQGTAAACWRPRSNISRALIARLNQERLCLPVVCRSDIPELRLHPIKFVGGSAAITKLAQASGDKCVPTYISTGVVDLIWPDSQGNFLGVIGHAFEATTQSALKGYTVVAGVFNTTTNTLRLNITNASDTLADR